MSRSMRRLKPAARPISALFIACLFAVVAAMPASAVDIITPGSGTWKAPAGVTSITIECWGAGGGGGVDTSSNNGGGGGGGGGAYAKVNAFPVTPGANYAYIVGNVGPGNGGDTSFSSSICVADGGAGGGLGNAGGAGGGGAGGTVANSTGDIKFAGGAGAAGANNNGGGGGSSAGSAAAGNSGSSNGNPGSAVTDGGPGGQGIGNGDGLAPISGPGGGGGGGEWSGSTRAGGNGFPGQIRITYKIATTTTINCGAGPFTFTGAAQTPCTATVTAPDGLNQSVAVSYSSNTNAGTASASATFAATGNYLASSANTTFMIDKAPTTTAVTCGAGPFTYTGAAQLPCTATVTGVGGLNQAVTVSYSNNTNAGTATASATYATTTNYLTSSDSTTFTINKANPTLSISNSPVTYDGAAKTATVAGSTTGTVSNIQYDGSATAPTNAGTYAVTADFTSTNANYNNLTGASAGNFVINKANPSLSVSNTPVTYNGAAQAATVTSSAAGTVGNVKYNNSSTVPTNAATYAITADFTSTDANYNSLTGATAGSFVINKATLTLSVTNSPLTYNGSARTATMVAALGATNVAGTASNIKYNTSLTAPTNAGSYAVTANFVPGDSTNYNSVTDGGAGSFVINPAATTTTVTCPAGPFTYTGAAQTPCTAAATGTGGLNQTLTVNYANNTGAGTASASASYAATTNYLGSSDSTTFIIGKATPTLLVTNSPATFDGTAKTATVVGSIAGAVSAIQYEGSATAPSSAGTYAVTADFLPNDTANYISITGAGAGNFVINKAPSTTTVTCTGAPFTYTGLAQTPCSATTTGVGGLSQTVTVVYSGNTNAGTASASATYAATANYLTSTGSTNFTIGKATPVIAVNNSPATYSGTAKTATVAATGPAGTVAGSAGSIKYDNSSTQPINAGTYAVTANFTPGDTTNYNSLTGAAAGNFVIDKAPTTTTVTCAAGPFTYTGAAITPTCSAAATGPGGLNATGLTVGFADNIDAGTATASAAYAGAANYLGSSGSTPFTIGKATPVIAISNSPVTYDGTARAATIAASATAGVVPGTFANVEYSLSATAPTNAGTYAVTADFTPADAANYNSLTAASAGSFVINKAASSTAVTCTGAPFAYTGVAQTPCTATAMGPGGLNLALTVSYANNTNAGTATADASYAASANYLGSTDSAAFTIGKAGTVTAVTCDPGPFVYTGAAQAPCAAGVTGPGGLNLTLTVVYASNTGAGTASASASYAGAANYFGSSDSTNFTIDKATPILAVTNSPVVFDGTAKTANIVASATAGTVNGALSNVKYGLSAAAPSDAGTYVVTADFAPTDGNNYNTLSGAGAGTFTINKAPTATAVTCNAGPFAYTGAAITPCAATVTGAGGLNEAVDVLYLNNVNAGTASASALYDGTANYFPSNDSKPFTIGKAATATTVTCTGGPFTYTGAAIEPCVAATTGPGGLNVALTVNYAGNIAAGTASAGTSYAGSANYLGSSGGTTFDIDKATPVLAVSNSPQVFDGTAKAATVAASALAGAVAGSASNIQYDGSASEPSDAGSYAVTADFTPLDAANYNAVSGGSAGSFVIQPAATTTTVTCSAGPFVYNTAPHEPCEAVATGPFGLNQAVAVVYADNTNAGTAAADANYAGAANYFPSSGSATFTIDKADPTLSISNSPVTYDGTAKAAAVNGSVAGTVSSVKYDGAATEPIGAGSYAVTADFLPDDAANYNAIGGAAAGSFVISKADPTLSITNSPAAYDGTPKSANVVGSVAGTASNLTYNTVAAAPTNAGTYAVNADFVPQDTANYNSLTGAAAGNFVIQKAGTPTLSVSNSPLIFNGLPQAAVVVGSVAGTPANVLYNGSAAVPTDAGSYVITADFTPDDTVNYDTVTGAAAGTLVIDQAGTATAVTCAAGPFTYTAAAIEPCTAAVSGPGGLNLALTVVYAGNVDAGTAAASAAFAGDANYLPSSNSATFIINMADPILAVTNSPAAYDGTPKPANVLGSVAGAVSNIRYNGSANAPVDAGTYAITADFVPDDGVNYNSLSGANAGNFVVQKAGVPVLTVTNSPRLFTGAAQAAVVVGSVPGTVSNIRYDGSATVPSDAGSYVVTADFVPDDTVNYDSITGVSAGSFTIGRAATTTAIDCGVGPYAYTGAAQTPCSATATGPGGLSEAVTVSYSSNVNVGIAAAGANYAGGANYLPSSAAGSFVIAKAPTSTTISCGSGPFAYTGAVIEPCAATVSGPGGLDHAVQVTYADNLDAGTASVSANFAGGINYLPSSGSATFTIAPAGTTTTVTCSGGPFTYNGTAFTPCVAEVSGPNGLSEVLPVVYANNTGAGTATASAGYTGTANHAASNGTATFAIAKAPTLTVVTCAAGPFEVTGQSIEPCTASVTGAAGLSQTLAVSYSNNTGAGTATASASYAGSVNYLSSSDTEVFVIGVAEEAQVFLHLPFMSK